MNMILVGSVVLFLHDPADVLLIISRCYTDIDREKLVIGRPYFNFIKNHSMKINIVLGVTTWFTWVLLRNIIFPNCVIRSCINFYTAPKEGILGDIVNGTIAY